MLPWEPPNLISLSFLFLFNVWRRVELGVVSSEEGIVLGLGNGKIGED